MCKKIILRLLLVLIIGSTVLIIPNNSNFALADGISEIAMELESGTILHQKNAQKRLPMASTTKIMTALLIAEECDLDQVITVPNEAVGVEGSTIYLKKDEEISIKDLLYGLMLRSGNDSACALAINHSGSVKKFVERMNERAKELGLCDTNFANPSGLPNDNHYTTAQDLCNLARAAMQNEIFAEVVSTKNYTGKFRSFTNKNKLLKNLEGANGIKTGFTEKAGRCLVSSCKRDNMDVVCVVLNCYDMFERSEKIIENCFDEYEVKAISNDKIFNYNGKLCSVLGEHRLVLLKSCELNFKLSDPIDKSACAKLDIFNQNNLIFSANLFTIN